MQTKQLLRLHKCQVFLHFYVAVFFDNRYSAEKKGFYLWYELCIHNYK